ncbi:thiaminase II/PqqC family protein [Streptomyces avermitilis]
MQTKIEPWRQTEILHELYLEHLPTFNAMYDEPFIQHMIAGDLSREYVSYYISQQRLYYTALARCYALGVTRATTDHWRDFCRGQADNLLRSLAPEDLELMELFGLSASDLDGDDRLPPTARDYVNHIFTAGHESLLSLMGALLPCWWTYTWLTIDISKNKLITPDNKFHSWIQYNSRDDRKGKVESLNSRIEELYRESPSVEQNAMKRSFEVSCRYELEYWRMCWDRQSVDEHSPRVADMENRATREVRTRLKRSTLPPRRVLAPAY